MRNQIQHVEKQKVRIESDYKSKYEGIMTEKLQELRDIYDEENEKLTNDVQNLYLAKVGNCYCYIEDLTFLLGTMNYRVGMALLRFNLYRISLLIIL